MSDLTERITAVLREHTPSDIGFCNAADCHWRWSPQQDHPAHVAEQVVAELREAGVVGFIRDDGHIKPRVYTDADAEAWVDE